MQDCPLSSGKCSRAKQVCKCTFYHQTVKSGWCLAELLCLTGTGNNKHTQRRKETQSDLNSVLNLKSQNLPGELHEYVGWEKGDKEKNCFLKNLLRTPEAGMKALNCDSTHEAEAGGLLQQGKPGLHSNTLFLKSKTR